jgi:glucokinase
MIKYDNDKRIVMTLDAGGTNFDFTAIQANQEVVEPITLPSNGSNLEKSLKNIKEGFKKIKKTLKQPPVAISFAFPGPADYPTGIIGHLLNLPGYTGGVPLGPILEEEFGIPVFINNDGDLFVYGEAIAGFLPYINNKLQQYKSPKRYRNLFGITLGTGFGAGIVHNGQLYLGDSSSGAEIWLLRNKLHPSVNAEEGASIRGVQRFYMEHAGLTGATAPSPKEIYEIGCGIKEGNRKAALMAYRDFGIVVGDSIANAITLLDTVTVIGGGLAGAHSLFLKAVVDEMNNPLLNMDGTPAQRLEMKAYNLENEKELDEFLRGETKVIPVPGTNRTITYDPLKRTGVGISRLGTTKAVAIGAYAYALSQLGKV